jgi:hypothetical protein
MAFKSIPRQHRIDGPARTQTGREVGVDAPGTAGPKEPATARSRFLGARGGQCMDAAARDFSRDCFRGGAATLRPHGFTGRSAAARVVNFADRRRMLARYEYAPRHVVDARWLGDYKVWLEFNDGRKGVVDLADELHGEELEPLRDRDRFCQFYLDYGLASIAWLDGQDFTPEFLYEKLKAMH